MVDSKFQIDSFLPRQSRLTRQGVTVQIYISSPNYKPIAIRSLEVGKIQLARLITLKKINKQTSGRRLVFMPLYIRRITGQRCSLEIRGIENDVLGTRTIQV